MVRRLLAGLFALCLAFGLYPVSALAADEVSAGTGETGIKTSTTDQSTAEDAPVAEVKTAEGDITNYNSIEDALTNAGEGSTITLLKDAASISIAGKKNLTIDGNNQTIGSLTFGNNNNGVMLKNAKFNQTTANAINVNGQGNQGITISCCTFTLGQDPSPWAAIYVQQTVTDLTIEKNTFEINRANASEFQCIGFAYTDNMRATDVTIDGNTMISNQTEGYSYFVIGSKNAEDKEGNHEYGINNMNISSNKISYSKDAPHDQYATNLANINGLEISNNTFDNCIIGICLATTDGLPTNNVTITGNTGSATMLAYLAGNNPVTGTFETDLSGSKLGISSYATSLARVDFDANGGSCDVSTRVIASGSAVGELPTPTCSGSYEFVGWYDSATNTPVSPETTFTNNATLYAVWRYTGPVSYGVSVTKAENGTVTTDRTYACAGTTVTVTATPDEGYDLTGVSVADGNGGAIEVTANDDGTYSFTMPTGGVTVTASFAASLPFSDVRPGDWYYEAVSRVYAGGLMTGYDDGSGLFGADDELTREQSAMILFRALGAQGGAPACGLADVAPGSWYADAVDWAFSTGLMTGYGDGSNRLGVGEALTREQLAVMLYRIAGSPDAGDYDPSAFSDGDEASEWARGALAWAVSTGVLEGSDDGRGGSELRPTTPITRAEMATMLSRLSDEGLLK